METYHVCILKKYDLKVSASSIQEAEQKAEVRLRGTMINEVMTERRIVISQDLMDRALPVMGSMEQVITWFDTDNMMLQGRPADIIQKPAGLIRIKEELARLAY